EHAAAQRITRTEDLGDVRLAVALTGLHQGFVLGRVEGLPLGLDPLEPLSAQRVDQLGVDELDPLEQTVPIDVLTGMQQGQLEVVQHLEQPPHHGLGGHLYRVRLLAQHALAVVVELGLEPLQVRAVLLDIPIAGGRRLILRGRGGLIARPLPGDIGEATFVGDLDHRRLGIATLVAPVELVGHEAPPSSTISPSTTSSSAASSLPASAAGPAAPASGWTC